MLYSCNCGVAPEPNMSTFVATHPVLAKPHSRMLTSSKEIKFFKTTVLQGKWLDEL